MKYVSLLLRAKGLRHLGHRAMTIGQRYGVTPARMEQALESLISTLEQHECQATFPVTAIALARHPAPICQLQERGMELAVHGWTHVNLENHSMEQQIDHLSQAMDIFDRHGISAVGFRSPYLRHNGTIRKAVESMGFRYLSNQPLLWNAVDGAAEPNDKFSAYQRAIDFYAPWSSADFLSLPAWKGQIVEIPVSLPDDEMLVERLGASEAQIAQIWTRMLRQTYTRGELLTIQFHPERATICTQAVHRLLSAARSYTPPVWIARLDEIAEWWRQRLTLRIDAIHENHRQYGIAIQGPAEARALVRSAKVIGQSGAWQDGYQIVKSHRFSVQCNTRPFIGVSTRTDRSLVNFLKHQGYLVETGERRVEYSIYFDQPEFGEKDGNPLLEKIEAAKSPLVRINRWPGDARSALAITGDIDALTLWDYGLRLFGR